MTHPSTGALLSLKSLGVMCVVASLFVWANSVERSFGIEGPWTLADRPHGTHGWRYGGYGWPWRYQAQSIEVVALDDEEAVAEAMLAKGIPTVRVAFPILLLDLALALLVSFALSLASERFVFRRLLRGPRPETKEDPK